MTPKEISERYIYLGMVRNADAQAAMFAEDGILEMPLAADGSPKRIEGRDNIRAYLTELHQQPPVPGQEVDFAASRYVLHTTADPDVFIAELDAGMKVDGESTVFSLVHIYRTSNGEITSIRDYYHE